MSSALSGTIFCMNNIARNSYFYFWFYYYDDRS
jgi:hypothetical protein